MHHEDLGTVAFTLTSGFQLTPILLTNHVLGSEFLFAFFLLVKLSTRGERRGKVKDN